MANLTDSNFENGGLAENLRTGQTGSFYHLENIDLYSTPGVVKANKGFERIINTLDFGTIKDSIQYRNFRLLVTESSLFYIDLNYPSSKTEITGHNLSDIVQVQVLSQTVFLFGAGGDIVYGKLEQITDMGFVVNTFNSVRAFGGDFFSGVTSISKTIIFRERIYFVYNEDSIGHITRQLSNNEFVQGDFLLADLVDLTVSESITALQTDGKYLYLGISYDGQGAVWYWTGTGTEPKEIILDSGYVNGIYLRGSQVLANCGDTGNIFIQTQVGSFVNHKRFLIDGEVLNFSEVFCQYNGRTMLLAKNEAGKNYIFSYGKQNINFPTITTVEYAFEDGIDGNMPNLDIKDMFTYKQDLYLVAADGLYSNTSIEPVKIKIRTIEKYFTEEYSLQKLTLQFDKPIDKSQIKTLTARTSSLEKLNLESSPQNETKLSYISIIKTPCFWFSFYIELLSTLTSPIYLKEILYNVQVRSIKTPK